MSETDQRRVRRAEGQRRFDVLARDFLDWPGVSRGPMFGSSGLRADGRFFAFVGRDGRLVVKLPPGEAAALVSAGEAEPVRAGRNRTREWVAVRFSDDREGAEWRRLLAEAYAHLTGRTGGPAPP
jgi:hypothetical protein